MYILYIYHTIYVYTIYNTILYVYTIYTILYVYTIVYNLENGIFCEGYLCQYTANFY